MMCWAMCRLLTSLAGIINLLDKHKLLISGYLGGTGQRQQR